MIPKLLDIQTRRLHNMLHVVGLLPFPVFHGITNYIFLSAEGVINVLWPWLSPLLGWCSLTMTFLGEFAYIWLTILSCYGSTPVAHGDWEGV